ncbi:MAG TPA: hypothetical protein VM537_12420 [Anaerolineae bacterium]|nr:hypothetical protein [Anaerolineae bacterium]
MAQPVPAFQPASPPPSLRQMFMLWSPIAASIAMMVMEPSIINIALGRAADAEVALAAYGVAYGLAILIESPIIMLLDASVARSTNRGAFALVKRFTLALALAVTALGLLVSLTPLYTIVVEQLMRIPADIAAQTRPTLQILSLWPLPIAWRRSHQGVLIRAQKTGIITAATMLRLLILTVVLFGGLRVLPAKGAVVAGIAMVISVTAEAALTTWATQRALQTDLSEGTDLTSRDLWRFYSPLLVTSVLNHSCRPMVSAGIASAMLARPSLAAWPVAWGFVVLISGPAWSLQQLTTTLGTDQQAFRRVTRFAVGVGIVLSLLLAAVAFTPLYDLVLGRVYNLSADLRDLARAPVQLMVIYPILTSAASLLRGQLIRSGRTPTVRAAMLVGVAGLGLMLVLGITRLSVTGVMLAAVATLAGALAELAWLRYRLDDTTAWRRSPQPQS